jgi:hypothetical protein
MANLKSSNFKSDVVNDFGDENFGGPAFRATVRTHQEYLGVVTIDTIRLQVQNYRESNCLQ